MSDTVTSSSTHEDHDRKGKFGGANDARTKAIRRRQRGLSRVLAQETRDGQEMAEVMLEIARDKGHRDRFKAADWVVTRLMGKAAEVVEVSGPNGAPLNPLSGVDVADLLALARAKTEGK